jgi:RNA-directed DNA polymerase
MKIYKSKWYGVDWKQVNRTVKGSQIAIAVAFKKNNCIFNKEVEGLQQELIKSFEARAFAIKAVTESKGSKTAGVDKVLWNTPEYKWANIHRLHFNSG